MAGKKRARSQKNGERGEAAFQSVATEHGLVCAKPPDYGFDFLCQVDPAPDAAVSQMSGAIVAAAVRSTEAKRAVYQLSRADAEHMLGARVPILLVLVHLRKGSNGRTTPGVFVRMLDIGVARLLTDFLQSGKKSKRLSAAAFQPAHSLTEILRSELYPGRQATLETVIAELRLAQHIPSPRLHIQHGAQGSMSIVETTEIMSAFDFVGDDAKYELFRRKTLTPRSYDEALIEKGLRPDLLALLEQLPRPVVLGGSTGTADGETIATLYSRYRGEVATADFRVHQNAHYSGYLHSSGFILAVSVREEHHDQHVHFVHAEVTSKPIDLRAHPDLFAFLRHLAPGGSWSFSAAGQGISAEGSGDVVAFGIYAFELARLVAAPGVDVPPALHLLRAAPDLESVRFLSAAGAIAAAGERRWNVGFHLREHDREEQMWGWIPVIGNVGAAGYVMWLRIAGRLLKLDDYIVGLAIDSVGGLKLEARPERFDKATLNPELVVRAGWPAIALTLEGLKQTSTDSSGWSDLGLIFDDEVD